MHETAHRIVPVGGFALPADNDQGKNRPVDLLGTFVPTFFVL